MCQNWQSLKGANHLQYAQSYTPSVLLDYLRYEFIIYRNFKMRAMSSNNKLPSVV